MRKDELAAAVGINDLDTLVLACLRTLVAARQIQQRIGQLSIDDVANRLKVSKRWLADECRAGRVEHVHLARKRFFTEVQVERLLARHTVVPDSVEREEIARRSAVRTSRTRRSSW
jgi:hypothetical protein